MIGKLSHPCQQFPLSRKWSAAVKSHEEWRPVGLACGGETTARVLSNEAGATVIAKPAFKNGTMPRGAHEKIAFDLAFEIGLPVPPVLLWTDEDANQFSLSAMAFDRPLTWAKSRKIRSEVFNRNCMPIFALGYIFHSWIGDSDHSGHGDNLLIDADSSENCPRLAFIDHEFSLSKRWKEQNPPVCALSEYYCPPATLPNGEIDRAINRIIGIAKRRVADIIHRVPNEYLTSERRDVIFTNLLTRREQLTDAYYYSR